MVVRAVILLLLAFPVYAGKVLTNSNSESSSFSGSSSAAQGGHSVGNQTAVEFNQSSEAVDLRDTVPSVYPPNITSSGNCIGSGSGGLSLPGFGVSGGKTIIDKDCVRINYAQALFNLGHPAVAAQILCTHREVYEAAERAAKIEHKLSVCAGYHPESGISATAVRGGNYDETIATSD